MLVKTESITSAWLYLTPLLPLIRRFSARPWSIHIIYFLALIGISGMLPFIFGRIVGIDTRVEVCTFSFVVVYCWSDWVLIESTGALLRDCDEG